MEEAEKKHLLQKFIDGTCTDEELRLVEQLRQEPGSARLFDELITNRSASDWDSGKTWDENMRSLTQRKKAELLTRISVDDMQPSSQTKIKKIRPFRIYRAAAVLIGALLTTAVVLWQIKKTGDSNVFLTTIEKNNPVGIPVRYMLPDSSTVYLGAGSSIRYKEAFVGAEREIILDGEAFFEVVPNPDKPFIVSTNGVRTKVLGTSFRVQSFDGEPFSVAVATGKVTVDKQTQGKSESLAVLTPGYQLRYDARSGDFQKEEVDISMIQQWKSGEMVFDELKMGTVVKELERRYNIRIIVKSPELANKIVGGTFEPDEPVVNIISMLAAVGEFNYFTKDNQTFTLTK